MLSDSKLPIYEQYESFRPPFCVKRAVERMLATVPQKYLGGLGCVVLTNEKALTGRRLRAMTWSRGKKVSAAKARGLYHPEWGSDPAWIEVRVDAIFKRYRSFWLRIPLIREIELGSTFFHELGHHIHAQHRPEFTEKEDVADCWMRKAVSNYLRQRFWYLMPLFTVMKFVDRHLHIVDGLRQKAATAAHARVE